MRRTETNITYGPQKKTIRNTNVKFSQQEVTFHETPLFFPEGLEKFFLLFYFISLPYLAGLAFLFFYIGNGDSSLFSSINSESSYMFTWVIGYEILAVIALLWILKKAINFTIDNSNNISGGGPTRNFRRP